MLTARISTTASQRAVARQLPQSLSQKPHVCCVTNTVEAETFGSASDVQTSAVTDRRQLLSLTAAACLFPAISNTPAALAEEDIAVSDVAAVSTPEAPPAPSTPSSPPSKRVYLDVKIEGENIGRIIVELFPDVPSGSQRFAELAAEKQGVGYRMSKFDNILPGYIRNEGVKRLSYSASEESPITGGDSVDALERELQQRRHDHSAAGVVSIIVGEANERPVKERLVAMNGQLVTVKEQAGEAPNGTAFTITTSPCPALDATNLVVGRVVEGMEVVQRITQVRVNRPRTDIVGGYFQVGKAIGDKRAIIAERGFNRPFQRIFISGGGVMS